MIVSLDPVYFNFDMSESDYLQFSRGRLTQSGCCRQRPSREGTKSFNELARA